MAMNSLDLLGSVNQRNSDNLSLRKNDSKDKSLFDSILNEASKETKKNERPDKSDRAERKESKSDNKDKVSKKDDNDKSNKVDNKSEDKTQDTKQTNNSITNDNDTKEDLSQKNPNNQKEVLTQNKLDSNLQNDESVDKVDLPKNSTLDIINLKAQIPDTSLNSNENILAKNIDTNVTKDISNTNSLNGQIVDNNLNVQVSDGNINKTLLSEKNLANTLETITLNNSLQAQKLVDNNIKNSNLMDNLLKQANQSILNQNNVSSENINGNTLVNNKLDMNTNNNLDNLVQVEPLEENLQVNNKQLANDLAKVSQPQSTNTKVQNTDLQQKSMLDRLSQSSQIIDQIQNEKAIASIATQTKGETLSTAHENIISNIYLSAQNNSVQNAQIIQRETGIQLIKNANNIEDVKKSAKVLDLNLQDAKVEVENTHNEKGNTIDIVTKAAFVQTIMKKDLLESTDSFNDAKLLHSQISSNAAYFTEDEPIDIDKLPATNLNLSQSAAYTLENRIIGAKQELRSTMNDVAKAMWENYRPPVTAFRLNLQPANLGTIAIVMRNDSKENTIKVSISMNNSSTLDAFKENETELAEAIKESFNNGTNLAFDFNMFDEGNSSNGDEVDTFVINNELPKQEASVNGDISTKKTDSSIYM